MNDISYRLKIIMDGLSVRKFAIALEMSPTTVQEYLKGRTPPADFIVRVCEQSKIDPWWLLTGKGEMRGRMQGAAADPAPIYIAEMNPVKRKKLKLANMLDRIIEEGDIKKIKAVESQLDLLDPGIKKQSHSHEDDGSGGYMGGLVA